MSSSASAPVANRGVTRLALNTHQPFARLDQRPVDAVDLVVQATRVAQVVPGGVAPPQRRVVRAAVDALAPLLVRLEHAI